MEDLDWRVPMWIILLELGTCNARVAGLIPAGDQYDKCMRSTTVSGSG